MKAKIYLALATALMVVGCTRAIYMPAETRVESGVAASDTVQNDRISKLIDRLQSAVRTQERVVIRDSVVYIVDERGDVKSKEVYRDRDRDYSEYEAVLRVAQVYDSLFHRQSARVDSILNEFRQVPVAAEKKASFWSRFKDGLAGAAVFALALASFWLLLRLKSKFFS